MEIFIGQKNDFGSFFIRVKHIKLGPNCGQFRCFKKRYRNFLSCRLLNLETKTEKFEKLERSVCCFFSPKSTMKKSIFRHSDFILVTLNFYHKFLEFLFFSTIQFFSDIFFLYFGFFSYIEFFSGHFFDILNFLISWLLNFLIFWIYLILRFLNGFWSIGIFLKSISWHSIFPVLGLSEFFSDLFRHYDFFSVNFSALQIFSDHFLIFGNFSVIWRFSYPFLGFPLFLIPKFIWFSEF